MRLFWNILSLVVLAVYPLAITGCGGLQGSKSFSPASFFLPGAMQSAPPTAEPTNLLATASGDIR